MSNKRCFITDKKYMFRLTVAIIRFYPKLYAEKRVSIQGAPPRTLYIYSLFLAHNFG